MAAIIAAPERCAAFLADRNGLAEAAIRTDYVNGTVSTPVAFLEGLYVRPEARRRGAAAELVATRCWKTMRATRCIARSASRRPSALSSFARRSGDLARRPVGACFPLASGHILRSPSRNRNSP